jgi:hypothetical protein
VLVEHRRLLEELVLGRLLGELVLGRLLGEYLE